MEFNDLFEHDSKKQHHGHSRYGEHNSTHNIQKHSTSTIFIKELVTKGLNSPTLRWFTIAAIVIMLGIAAIALLLLFPLILKLLDFIAANGIKGLIDSIWEGYK